MPVKWTPDTDQVLLLKILETSDFSPKFTEISEKWPVNLERPTPRAISERILKIRAMAKASGTAGHIATPPANSGTSTPRKKAANGAAKNTPSKKTNGTKGGAGKRKRGGRMGDEDANDDSEAEGFKSDNNGIDDSDDDTPKKKAKVIGMVKSKGKDKRALKMEDVEEENKTIHDKGYENPYDEDDNEDVMTYA